MKRLLTLAAVAVFAMAARPGTEQQLIQQLNGQPTRWVLPDGGRSGVFTQFDGGAANNKGCMALTGATTSSMSIAPNVLVFVPLVPVNMCERPSSYSTKWDGGCNTLPTDENYGVPLPVNVPQYTSPDSQATALCFVTDAGYLAVPVFFAQ